MTPRPRHQAALRQHRLLVVAGAAVALAAAGTIPAAIAGQRGPDRMPATVGGLNLAAGRPATGSAPCRADEDASKAVNGTVAGLRDKWCSGAAAKTLTVDLGSPSALTSVVVRHAGSGGERAALNTRDFDVAASVDGTAYSTLAAVRNNTAAVTTHAATATARYLRLTVLRAEQTGTGGAARIYEFEAYGTVAPPPPSPVPSATAPSPPPPVPSPSAAPKPDPVPPPSASCFPFPAHDATQGPRPQIVLKPGVPALDKKYLDPATTIWGNQWPGAWQRFATPSALRDPNAGVNQAILTTDPHASFGDGTIEINYKDWMDSVDRGDPGMWMHESAHLIQADYPYPDFPKFYGEGITDFIRFVSHGEDPAWALISLSATDSSYFDEQKVWDSGYRQAARFLLWVTQHYDPSGAQYKLVHDLNVGASGDKPDWQGMFVQATGKSYHQLFTEYAADRKVNPHC